MSRSTKRNSTARDGGAVEDRLTRLLETPALARVVPQLPPETLHQLIRHRGLGACAELVTAATPAQLTSLLDLDLWRQPRPGRDQEFDVGRFGEWLEVLVDTGVSVAARTVAALDRNLVVAGLARYVRVFDPGIFEPTAQSDDEPTDRHEAMREGDAIDIASRLDDDAFSNDPGTGRLECEVGGYIVRARRSDAWDAIVALLLALEEEHGGCFHAVMGGCRRLSNSRPEIDGLDDLALAPEQHLHDLTVDRERRQSQQGYASAADARAFLEMARGPRHAQAGRSAARPGGVHPIVAAYFRAADDADESPAGRARRPESTWQSRLPAAPSAASRARSDDANADDLPESLEAVMALLTEAGVMREHPRALLETGEADPQAARLGRLRRLLAYVQETNETAYFTRSRELAFLANTLLAGCSIQSRPFTPHEASDAAASICNLGIEYWPSRWPQTTSRAVSARLTHGDARGPGRDSGNPADGPPDAFLIDHDLVTTFEVGWSVLHHDVCLFTAQQLVSTLGVVDSVDVEIRRGLAALRRTLATALDAGTPWQARSAAEALALLDMTAWIGVLGLLDECPVLPAALSAILDARTTTVSATEFTFISTPDQIEDVHRFMRKLPDVLSR